MRERLTFLEPDASIAYAGMGTVAELLARVVREDLESHLNNSGDVNFSEIEVDAEDAEEGDFAIQLWQDLADSDANGKILRYDLAFQIVNDDPKKVLDKTLITDGHAHYKLTRPEALFFAGLAFRTLAAKKHSKRL